ncbi:MAG: glycosyltransferase family 39 protein, partial [Chloroflexota bacterium]
MSTPNIFSRKIYWWEFLFLLGIVLLAAIFRWRGLNWDQNHHYHPDERYISWVATSVNFFGTQSIGEAFDPQTSTFNPFYWPAEAETGSISVPSNEARKFAYGHLPLYLGVITYDLIGFVIQDDGLQNSQNQSLSEFAVLEPFDQITIVGRWLSGLLDIGTILLVFLLGRRLAGTRVGLTAALLLAMNVMHIQQAHFFISDPALSFFVVLTLLLLVRSLPEEEHIFDDPPHPFPRSLTWAAIASGLAIGSKFSAILLGLPAFFVILVLTPKHWFRRSVRYGLLVLISFFLTNPFAILDNTCEVQLGNENFQFVFNPPAACYLENVTEQSDMVGGSAVFPFVRQYDGTLPYIYHIENQLNWGMGVALGYTAFVGFAAFAFLGLRNGVQDLRNGKSKSIWVMGLVLLGWCLPYFLVTGQFHVKFMRYLLPLSPFLMIFAAWIMWLIPLKWARRGLIGFVSIFTFVYASAFSSIYSEEHPWHLATEWFVTNAEAGSVVANEVWDESLPSSLREDGVEQSRGRVKLANVNWLSRSGDRDSIDKLVVNLEEVANSDYYVVGSNRSYGVVPRLPDLYPLSGQFHELLFEGELGFEVVYVSDR